MRGTNSFVRSTALLVACYLIAIVSLLVVSPLTALVGLAAVILGCRLSGMMSERRSAMLFARAGPAVPVKLSSNATSTTRNSAVGASDAVGFRLCRSTHKYDTTGTITAHFVSGKVMSELARPFGRKSSKYPAAASWSGRIIPRKSQCNLYAYNANDQSGFACGLAA